jgi:succinyl-CoA synthetase alpha subunit
MPTAHDAHESNPRIRCAVLCCAVLGTRLTRLAAVASTTRSGLGQSLCIGVGGDLVAGTDLREALAVLAEDADTDAIIMIGEIGGSGELEAAEWIKAYNARESTPSKALPDLATRDGKGNGHRRLT